MNKIVNYASSSDNDSDDSRPRKKQIIVKEVEDLEYKSKIRNEVGNSLLGFLPKPANVKKDKDVAEPAVKKQKVEFTESEVLEDVCLFTMRKSYSLADRIIDTPANITSKPAIGPARPPNFTRKPKVGRIVEKQSEKVDNSELVQKS